ncbi:MAG: putative quinol monooxygenase [Candidatus Hermodarchaeota archaeon]
MLIYCVTVYVKSEYREAFIEATLENARNTRKEPGNLRFDVLECLDDPVKFFLYEVYREGKDVDAHKETNHYKKWRETVAEMMAKPREGLKHKNLFPETEEGFESK